MDYKTLEEWQKEKLLQMKKNTHIIREDREKSNKEDRLLPPPPDEYKHHTESDAIQLGEWLELLSDNFKSRLLRLMNDYELYSPSYNHFYIIYKTVQTNQLLKKLYSVEDMPYSHYKYDVILTTLAKRAKKNGSTVYAEASPQRQVYYFKWKCEEFLSDFNFYHNQSTKRDKIKIRNELIDQLIELIVSDNYVKDKKYRFDTRISKVIKKFYDTEEKILDLKCKTHKNYVKLIKIEP